MDGWILVSIGTGSLLCFLIGIWADWMLGRADSDDDGRPDDYYLRASPGPQTGSLTDKQLLAIEAQRAAIFAQTTQQLASPQWIASQAALAYQLVHTTPTSQWNSGNYYQPPTPHPVERITDRMRAWGCAHPITIYKSVQRFATIVNHGTSAETEIPDVSLYGTTNDEGVEVAMAWLQSVCDGSDEFWGWHEAYGVWDESEQLHADYLE